MNYNQEDERIVIRYPLDKHRLNAKQIFVLLALFPILLWLFRKEKQRNNAAPNIKAKLCFPSDFGLQKSAKSMFSSEAPLTLVKVEHFSQK